MTSIAANIVFGVVFFGVFAAFIAGAYAERWRARLARNRWKKRRDARAKAIPLRARSETPPLGATEQLAIVMAATFEKRPLLSRAEARFLYAAENAIKDRKLGWRVMAQVSLGEILSSPDPRAYSTINSKRVDLLIVSGVGEPLAAIEYQGQGHYRGSAPARDATKKEALRRAGVRFIEVTPEHDARDVAREIERMALAVETSPRAPTAQPWGNQPTRPARRDGDSILAPTLPAQSTPSNLDSRPAR